MNTAVFSYSFTGNNEALAEAVARTLGAEHIRITEPRKRTTGTIILDVTFNRTPKTEPAPQKLDAYERVILIAPVWMGQPAFPLRVWLDHLRAHPRPYAFCSISGGGLNPNPGLKDAIQKRAGAAPTALVDLHISDLLPAGTERGTKETSAYRLTPAEVEKLAATTVEALNKVGF